MNSNYLLKEFLNFLFEIKSGVLHMGFWALLQNMWFKRREQSFLLSIAM